MIVHELFYFHRFYVQKVLQIPEICSLKLSKTIFLIAFLISVIERQFAKILDAFTSLKHDIFVLVWREIKKM